MISINDARFFRLLQEGVFEVREDFTIWRIRSLHENFGAKRYWPRRCERPFGNGYLGVEFRTTVPETGKRKTYRIPSHRLVWMKKFGLIPDGKLHINHINGIKKDNRIENLELVTQAENNRHAMKFLPRNKSRGERQWCSKLKEEQVIQIRQRGLRGCTTAQLARDYGVSENAVYKILKGKTWAHVK